MENQAKINHQTPPFGKQMLADAVCRPILFSTPMVKAILDGRKTQTRRLFKVNKQTITADEESVFFDVEIGEAVYNSIGGQSWWQCPYGNVGDILWVRETFYEPLFEKLNGKYYYKADLEEQGWNFKWKPSLFMPKEACRLFLEITNIRCERLQDITGDEAVKEGIMPLNMSSAQLAESGQLYFDYSKPKQFFNDGLPSFWSFNSLWCSINGNKSWEENPFVWVIEFKRVDCPNGFH